MFSHFRRLKNIFFEEMILVVWKYAQPVVLKYLFLKYILRRKVSGGLEVCANASKHVFDHSRR
jgi:hypothetical protein